jgi:Reverse transcriptase (RNA-dependent DNA polymerase)
MEVSIQDLELAWKRIKLDIPDRIFVSNPFEIQIIEKDLGGFLTPILDALQSDQYAPNPLYICEVPKAKNLVRPGAILTIEDRVVYYTCLGLLVPTMRDAVVWSSGKIDFSHQLSADVYSPEWLANRFIGWDDFRKQSVKRINGDVTFVVETDITGFYENIDLSMLISDLKSIGGNEEVCKTLSRCLNKWAQVNGRGIPQGYSPSDLLAKLYLNSTDLNLSAGGFDFFRYVDDIRIFCLSRPSARRALLELSLLLRKRGLNLQSAKTRILGRDEAILKIEGVHPILEPIINEFKSAIRARFHLPSDPNLAEADELVEDADGATPIEAICEAFNLYFINGDLSKFDKTLFHFLIKRLGKAQNSIAVDYCLAILAEFPEETRVILTYVNQTERVGEAEQRLIEFVRSEEAVYPFQKYEILAWFSERNTIEAASLLELCRELSKDRTLPKYVKPIIRKLLGKYGTQADVEFLQRLYDDVDAEKERSELICCIQSMEKGRRNAFYGRAETDGLLVRLAIKLVKENLDT